jgi:hypothetical protein
MCKQNCSSFASFGFERWLVGLASVLVVFQLVCLGQQIFIEVLHPKITLFYSIFWITKTIKLIVE